MTRYLAPLLLSLLLAPACVQADELGRLFFTPRQRAQLDAGHGQNGTSANGSPSSILTVNGIVQKDGGARTVWINGVPQNAGHSDERHPESTTITVPGQSKNSIRIKAGQQLPLGPSAEPATRQ